MFDEVEEYFADGQMRYAIKIDYGPDHFLYKIAEAASQDIAELTLEALQQKFPNATFCIDGEPHYSLENLLDVEM